MNRREETPVEKFNRENRERREKEKKEKEQPKNDREFFIPLKVEGETVPAGDLRVEITDAKKGQFTITNEPKKDMIILDDPYQETTEEDRKKVMAWFEKCVDKTNEGKNFFLDLVKKYKKEVLALLGIPPHVTGPAPAAYRAFVDADHAIGTQVGSRVAVDHKETRAYPQFFAKNFIPKEKRLSFGTVQAVHVNYKRDKKERTTEFMVDVLLDSDKESIGFCTSTMTPGEGAEDITMDAVKLETDALPIGDPYRSGVVVKGTAAWDYKKEVTLGSRVVFDSNAEEFVPEGYGGEGYRGTVVRFEHAPNDIIVHAVLDSGERVHDVDKRTVVGTVKEVCDDGTVLVDMSASLWDACDAEPIKDVRRAFGLPESTSWDDPESTPAEDFKQAKKAMESHIGLPEMPDGSLWPDHYIRRLMEMEADRLKSKNTVQEDDGNE